MIKRAYWIHRTLRSIFFYDAHLLCSFCLGRSEWHLDVPTSVLFYYSFSLVCFGGGPILAKLKICPTFYIFNGKKLAEFTTAQAKKPWEALLCYTAIFFSMKSTSRSQGCHHAGFEHQQLKGQLQEYIPVQATASSLRKANSTGHRKLLRNWSSTSWKTDKNKDPVHQLNYALKD